MEQCKSRLIKITHRLVRLREQPTDKADLRPTSRRKSANVVGNLSGTDNAINDQTKQAINVGSSGSYHPRGDDRLTEAYQYD
jgi:hypothetical protein